MHRTLPVLTGLSAALLSLFAAGQALAAEAQYQVRIPAHVQMSRTAPSPDAADPLSVSVATATLNAGTVGMPYAYDFTPLLSISGGPEGGYNLGEVSWAVEAGGALPEGLSLSAAGVISGAPTQTGEYAFTVRASYKTAAGAQSFSVRVNLPISFTLQSGTGAALGTVSYGKIPVGLRSNFVPIRLVNSSGASLSSVAPSFPKGSPFSVDSHDCGYALAANAYCTLQTRFMPQALTAYSETLQVSAEEGDAALGSFTGEGGDIQVTIEGASGATTINADTPSDFNVTFRNHSSANIQLHKPISDYKGAFKYEPNGAVTIPANGTAVLAGKIIAGKGTHNVPILFQAYSGGVYTPALMGSFTFNSTSTYTHTATETLLKSQDLPSVFERKGYEGIDNYAYGSGIGNSWSVAQSDARALIIRVPANAVSPNLYIHASGTGNSTLSIREGAITGSTVWSHTFPTFGRYNLIANLSAGKTYYLVPRNNANSTAYFYYASLRWN